MTDQAHRALAMANAVRSRRRALLEPVRRGDVLFAELDLDEPALQGMSVYTLLRSVRVNRPASGQTARGVGGTGWTARRVLRRFGCPAMLPLGELAPDRKARLKEIVAALIPAQRPQ